MPSNTHQDVLNKLEKLSSCLEELNTNVGQLNTRVEKIEHDTSDVIESFNTLRGGFRVLQVIGKLATPVAAIGAAWASFKAGLWR